MQMQHKQQMIIDLYSLYVWFMNNIPALVEESWTNSRRLDVDQTEQTVQCAKSRLFCATILSLSHPELFRGLFYKTVDSHS